MFDSVAEAVEKTGADVSVIFVPAKGTKAAVVEAVDAGVPLVVVITEGVAVHDTAAFFQYAQDKGSTRIIGPNCPGIITPGRSNVGIIPANITQQGPIGLVSKSGTLTYQLMYELRDLGFSTNVGIGGDPIIGTTHIDCLAAYQEDPETKAIVLVGEIGGDAEERAAAFIKENVDQARGRLCRGVHGAGGQDDGPRRRDRVRLLRDRRSEEGGAGGGRSQGRPDAVRDGPADAGDRRLALGRCPCPPGPGEGS